MLEALRLVFLMVRIVPYMNSFFELSHVSVEGNRIDPDFLESFGAFERAYDPGTYKTSIQTNLTNLVLEEELQTLIEPKNGFITPRSSEDFEITNDDSIIPTTRPINQLVDFNILFNVTYTVQYKQTSGSSTETGTINDVEVPQEFFDFKLRDFVYEETLYNTLENINEINYDFNKDE